ncbi:MFS transporter [Planosporangium flavigriseum]|uniref:MFS transporter n=1 Tax=Planosporangium flavigriseum TaxID=373681 RepID=A0A8J3LWF2_9ACTN|nr:MFS transporter [Planosporangium flavigriseum]NJC65648.1 MFS transporter [Planosporangium flavigriseum]GIG74811.1 MFS transporter [Planosporangium flavigriseum]
MVAETGVRAELSSRRERIGWYFYDWANSAFSTTVVTVFFGPYLGSIAEHAADANGRVYPLGIPVAAGSLFAYTVSLSVFLQVFVLPTVGAIADRTSRKKELLALLANVGAGATIGMMFVTGDRYLLGAVLLLVANLAFGASIVVYNSFLPQLAGPDERDRVSSVGWAIGYIGGGLLLALNLAVLVINPAGIGTGEIARWSIVAAGVWWAGFTIIPLARLRNRPAVAGEAHGSALLDGFRQLGRTLRELKAYPLTLFFLVAYLIYNDGIQTVIAMASVYADKELGLDQSVQIETILLVQFLAFVGAIALGRLARRFGAWKTILASLVLWTVVLGIGYFLPAKQPVAFMLMGLLLGIVLGGTQALSRSLFSQLIPHGKEAEYFGLYEISDKGTSWLGPLLFGLAYQLTGSYRVAIVSLVVFFVVGFVALAAVPIRRAIVAVGNTPPRVL